MKVIKVLALTRYGRLGASSRVRFLQYIPWLERAGIQVTVQPLISDALLERRYKYGGYSLWQLLRSYFGRLQALWRRHEFDVIWIEKEALPWWPLWIERAFLSGVPYVLDYDDAIFHQYDQHKSRFVRHIYGRRIDKLMSHAEVVIVGNKYLAERASGAGAVCVAKIPTVIDLERYPVIQRKDDARSPPRIVWIGSPATVHYLKLLHEPLSLLSRQHAFILRVIGVNAVDIPDVQIEVLPWTENTEVKNIIECDVGVMPLMNSPWELGKCGYKLVQFMACELPVVASNVGANYEVVQQGKNGYLVNSTSEWVAFLGKLLGDRALRTQMGLRGRQLAESTFCVQETGPKIAELLRRPISIH